jgi:Spx/MgsR family transcriptional regulator
MIRLFGIPNCDTVKKARAFFESRGIAYEFTDFKKTPPTKAELERWEKVYGAPPVNTRGTTYRKCKDAYEALPQMARRAFVAANPSLIKRPVVECDGVAVTFGFDEAAYRDLFHGPR